MVAQREDDNSTTASGAYSRLTTDDSTIETEAGPAPISPSRRGGVATERGSRAASCSPARSSNSTPRFTSAPPGERRNSVGGTPMSQRGELRTPTFAGGPRSSPRYSVSPGPSARMASCSPTRSPAATGELEDPAPTLLTRSKDCEDIKDGAVESPHSSLATPSRPLLSFMSTFSLNSSREATETGSSAPTPPAASRILTRQIMEVPASHRVRREILVARHNVAPILVAGDDIPEPSPRSPNGRTWLQRMRFTWTPKLVIAASLALLTLVVVGSLVVWQGSRPGQALRHGGKAARVTDERPPADMCTVEDRTLLQSLQGSSKSELFAAAADCGHKTLRLGWSIYFDHDGFLKCMSDYWSDVSSRCYECFFYGAKYSAANCKAACMMSWCSPQCLACVKGNEEQEQQCTGLSSPLTPEPC